MIFCENCGTDISNEAKFCFSCGAKINITKLVLPSDQPVESILNFETPWTRLKLDDKRIKIFSDFLLHGGGYDVFDDSTKSTPKQIEEIKSHFLLTKAEVNVFIEKSNNTIGVIKYSDDEYYIGELLNGTRNGFGVYGRMYNTGELAITYHGFWLFDKRHGTGIEINDIHWDLIYNGEWKFDLYYGKGIYFLGEIYAGEFVQGKFEGQGVTFSNGKKVFEGSFINGYKSGKGIQYFYDSDTKDLEGEWKNDKFRNGTQYYKNGNIKFSGEFDAEDDDVEFTDPHGNCIEYYDDGSKKFEGQWKYGLYHGNGTLYNEDGTLLKGIFSEGSLIKKINQNDNNESPIKPSSNLKKGSQIKIPYKKSFTLWKAVKTVLLLLCLLLIISVFTVPSEEQHMDAVVDGVMLPIVLNSKENIILRLKNDLTPEQINLVNELGKAELRENFQIEYHFLGGFSTMTWEGILGSIGAFNYVFILPEFKRAIKETDK